MSVGVSGCDETQQIPEAPNIVRRWAVFSLCGRLVGHFLVSDWLCVARGVLKRKASTITKGWDDEREGQLAAAYDI